MTPSDQPFVYFGEIKAEIAAIHHNINRKIMEEAEETRRVITRLHNWTVFLITGNTIIILLTLIFGP